MVSVLVAVFEEKSGGSGPSSKSICCAHVLIRKMRLKQNPGSIIKINAYLAFGDHILPRLLWLEGSWGGGGELILCTICSILPQILLASHCRNRTFYFA